MVTLWQRVALLFAGCISCNLRAHRNAAGCMGLALCCRFSMIWLWPQAVGHREPNLHHIDTHICVYDICMLHGGCRVMCTSLTRFCMYTARPAGGACSHTRIMHMNMRYEPNHCAGRRHGQGSKGPSADMQSVHFLGIASRTLR